MRSLSTTCTISFEIMINLKKGTCTPFDVVLLDLEDKISSNFLEALEKTSKTMVLQTTTRGVASRQKNSKLYGNWMEILDGKE